MCTKAGYKHRYAISLLLAFLAISCFPLILKHKTNMVASYHIVMLLCLDSYEQCCTQLLKVLHQVCNTDVCGVSLIYPHSPSGTVLPRIMHMYGTNHPQFKRYTRMTHKWHTCDTRGVNHACMFFIDSTHVYMYTHYLHTHMFLHVCMFVWLM